MQAFLVDLKNRPGALADVAEAIAAKGININGVTGATCGDGGRAAITTADESATRAALDGAGVTYTTMDVTEVPLAHRPGSLAAATRRLADAGINVEAIMPTGMTGNDVTVGFVTSDPARAREVLAAVGSTR